MNILVTALGTMASQCIVRQLKKRKNIFIIGADIYPRNYISTSNDVDEFIQVRSVLDHEKYLIDLLEICKRFNIDVIFPIIDEEVELLAKNIGKLRELEIIPCVSNWQSVELCRDKILTYNKIKMSIPEIAIESVKLADYNNQWEYPVFIKPIKGRASIGCLKVNTRRELEFYSEQLNTNEYIIQKYYEGRILAVDTIRDAKNNEIVVIPREELLRNKNGCGTVVQIINDTNIENICARIANAFNLEGVFNAEFFLDESGYHLIEINPRFSAGSDYTCMAGIDIVNSQLNVMTGENILNAPISYGNIYSKRYESYSM